ncbi:hypothetical protein [Cohnella caldifontis]|uniref:hypothetical protein n=1 Tax=Cohnella caldifontis TaxID=3027471 RepID=UPI0023EC7EA1|nr:hypothetical protein [Cohnella sp. YIM B05605]
MIRLAFREHPEREPSGKVSILGNALCGAERMDGYASRRNPGAPRVARIYLELGARRGVRGDVAFCQAMVDTKTWTEEPQGPPWRPYAQLIWGRAAEGWPESELERRVERHLDWLAAIASRNKEQKMCWEDLNGVWAVPGYRYGQDILAVWRNMMEWSGDVGAGKPGAASDERKPVSE